MPIQKKMLAITLVICGGVLCLAIAALFTFQVLNFRGNFERETRTLAVIIANNSTAAMAFKDDQAGREILRALQAEPSIIGASLALPDGSVFAQFGNLESRGTLAQFPPSGTNVFRAGQLLMSQTVVNKGEALGTLYLRADYERTLEQLLRLYCLLVAAITAVSIILASVLCSRLVSRITQPILHLAKTAQLIGQKKDYSLRAGVTAGNDEVGRLTESFNQMLSRIQSQDAALSLSQHRMEALIHSIDGIVWERAPDSLGFTFVSRQSQEILGFAPDIWLGQPKFWEEKLDPQDAARAQQTVQEMAARGESYSCEYRMVAADGRTVWIRESGTVLLENGKAVAIRGILQDITQAKLDAEQLDKLNRQLVSTSRTAGMAEVATGVLHNVGNVLNSVSVSATVVAERLRRSKVTKLQRALGILSEHKERLAEFLTKDPKGQVLPTYLATIAEQLASDQTRLLAQMDSVGQHIEHIKEIVAMQQNYAKVSGVYETLSPTGLVEDALKMNMAAFDRHGIELTREFADNLLSICVDRHKVLQILINVLRNAKYAMEEKDPAEKHLVVRVYMAAPDRIQIAVKDNGVGIAPENLIRIFNHGFTTKKHGHGFGLHSGANAAKEMGGSLSAHSEGPGRGAEFTLELPTAAISKKDHAHATV